MGRGGSPALEPTEQLIRGESRAREDGALAQQDASGGARPRRRGAQSQLLASRAPESQAVGVAGPPGDTEQKLRRASSPQREPALRQCPGDSQPLRSNHSTEDGAPTGGPTTQDYTPTRHYLFKTKVGFYFNF